MVALFSAMVSVGLIILVGFIAGRTLTLSRSTLSQLSVYVLAPALVIDSLYRTTISFVGIGQVLLGFTLICGVLYFLVWWLAKFFKLTPAIQKSLMMTTLFPNNGNLGLPLIAFALGSAGLERAIIYMIASSIFLFGVAPALLHGESLKSGLLLVLRIPLIWAMGVGLLLHELSVALPDAISQGLHLLGESAIPLALIILGIELSDTQVKAGRYEFSALSLRLLLAPLLALGIGRALAMPVLDLQVFILQSAMPCAINSIVLVAEFGGDAPRTARTIVASTLASFLTLPIVLGLMAGLN